MCNKDKCLLKLLTLSAIQQKKKSSYKYKLHLFCIPFISEKNILKNISTDNSFTTYDVILLYIQYCNTYISKDASMGGKA